LPFVLIQNIFFDLVVFLDLLERLVELLAQNPSFLFRLFQSLRAVFQSILEIKHFSFQARLPLGHVLAGRLELGVFIFELSAGVVELDLEPSDLLLSSFKL
jgi:hypothetical protein